RTMAIRTTSGYRAGLAAALVVLGCTGAEGKPGPPGPPGPPGDAGTVSLPNDDAGTADAEAGVGPAGSRARQPAARHAATAPTTARATGEGTLASAWTQTGGPPAALTGADTATLSFTTLDFATAMGPLTAANARFDVLGID